MINDSNRLWGLFDLARAEMSPDDFIYDMSKLICIKSLSEKKYKNINLSKNYWNYILNSKDIVLTLKNTYLDIEKDIPSLRGVFTYNEVLAKGNFWRNVCKEINEFDITSKYFSEIWMNMLEDFSKRYRGAIFYTSKIISKLISGIIENKTMRLFDPFCGVGGMFYELFKENKDIDFTGLETNKKISNICKLNLTILQVENFNISNENYLFSNNKKYEMIISDPPLGLKLNKEDISKLDQNIFKYGPLSGTDASFVFIQKIISDLSENGKAIIIATPGILFRSGSDKITRKELLNHNLIESIIQLPSNVMTNTSIAPILLIISKNKRNVLRNGIRFMDLSGYAQKIGGSNTITEEDILKISKIYHKGEEVSGLARFSNIDEIMDNDFDLSVNRYVKKNEIINTRSISDIQIELDTLAKERSKLNKDFNKNLEEVLKILK
ncbi:N-6 DNA methylase [Candidatus Pacearchaeota archaeon]|nr:N-6 DNA methylase [Candidatus Pacearchaeota archaeon]